MKKVFLGLFCVMALWACTDEVNDFSSNTEGDFVARSVTKSMDAATAQEAFVRILSKAVYENSHLRQFIKNEALQRFDNDYDVFYPLIKDKKVEDNKTFRDILLSYCENEDILRQIEDALPLLNIFTPNLAFIGGISPEEWDITDSEMAVYNAGKGSYKSQALYINGDSIVNLEPGEIPAFPTLIVKENERMEIMPTPRSTSGINSYRFKDDAFNAALNAPTLRATDWDNYYETESIEAYVPADELDLTVIQAYQESKKNKNFIDRDYIYYGLSSTNQNEGKLDPYVRERLYKFRIDAAKYLSMADQSDDPRLNEENGANGVTNNKISELTKEQILNEVWTNGAFELYFVFYCGTRDNTPLTNTLTYSVDPKELFQVKKIHVHKRHKTALRHSKYYYYVNYKDLVSKWVKAQLSRALGSKDYVLPGTWDAYNNSLIINGFVYERDDKEQIEKQITLKEEFSTKVDFTMGIDTGTSTKFSGKITTGFSNTQSRTESIKIITQKDSDDLGTLSYNFKDPVILSDAEKDTKGYKVKTVSNGTVEAIILPERIR